MSALAILTAAQVRIADPAAWSQYLDAVDADGKGVGAVDAAACRWCAYGALAAEGAGFTSPAAGLLRRAARAEKASGPITINIDRGHTAVLAMYDRVIALASAEEAR